MSHDPSAPQSPIEPSTSLALGICSAGFYSDASLVYRIRSFVADECQEDEWLTTVLTQAANRIERMNRGLMLIKSGGGTPEERRAYCQEVGISTADADGMARAAIASPNIAAQTTAPECRGKNLNA